MIIMAYIMLIVYWYIFTYQSGHLQIPGSFSWIVIIATLVQFTGISLIQSKRRIRLIETVAEYSMIIYLIHPIFCELCMQFFGRIFKWFPNAGLIPVYSLIAIGMSVGIAVSMQYLNNVYQSYRDTIRG